MSIICIDIGTTRCKLACISETGRLLTEIAFVHNAQLPDNLIDCEQLFHGIVQHLDQLFSHFSDIAAITATSFGETFVCVGSNGLPVMPSLLYFDTRCKPQVNQLAERLGDENIYLHTGHRFGTGSPLAKLFWLLRHEPEQISRTQHLLFVADYVLFRLGADPFISQSFARRSHWLDTNTETIWQDALSAVGFVDSRIPPVRKAGEIVGTLSNKFSHWYGAGTPPKLLAGGHDQTFATIGAGGYMPGDAVYGMGTSDSLNIILPVRMINSDLYQYGYDCERYLDSEFYLTFAHIPSGGKSLSWAYTLLYASSGDLDWNDCQRKIEQAASCKSNVLFLPFINGIGTPRSPNWADGCFIGLTDQTDKQTMFAAVLEGIVFEMLINRQLLQNNQISPKRILVSGGGTQSPFWLQLRVDIWGQPFHVCMYNNTGLLGLYAVAAASLHYYKTASEAIAFANPVVQTCEPDFSNTTYYYEKFNLYRDARNLITSHHNNL